jgi:hypothetical protein
MTVRDVQSEIIAALQVLLAAVGQVEEGDVRALFDADDDSYPDEFIVLQPGDTDEVLGQHPRMPNSVPERTVINIVLVSKRRQYAAALRAMRLAVKVATAGRVCGLDSVFGITAVGFQTESPARPAEGRRWAAHVMPLQISYIQPLK